MAVDIGRIGTGQKHGGARHFVRLGKALLRNMALQKRLQLLVLVLQQEEGLPVVEQTDIKMI